MASSIIGALRVTLGLDTAAFESGAKKATSQASALGKSLQASSGLMKSALAGLVPTLTIAALAGLTKAAFDYTDAINDLSASTGASTKLIQEFRYAAQLSGSSVGAADEAIQKFSRNLGLAQQGSKEQVQIFNKLGITSRTVDGAFAQAVAGISKLSSAQEQNAATTQLMGKTAGELVQVMGGGVANFNALAAAAHSLGIVLGDDVIKNAGVANDKLDQLKMVVTAQWANTIAQNASAFAQMADELMQVGAAAAHAWEKLAQLGNFNTITAKFMQNDRGTVADSYRQLMSTPEGQQKVLAEYDRRIAMRKAKYANRPDLIVDGKNMGQPAFDDPEISRRQSIRDRLAAYAAAVNKRAAAAVAPPTGINPPHGGSAFVAAKSPEEANAEAKKAGEERKRRLRDENRSSQESEQLQQDILDARSELLPNVQDQARIEREKLDLEVDQKKKDIDLSVALGQRSQAESDSQKASIDVATGLKRQAIDIKEAQALADQATDARVASLQSEEEIATLQGSLADTADDRRAAELRLLDLQEREERVRLDAIVASQSATEAEKEAAKQSLAALAQQHDLKVAGIDRQNEGPLAAFRREIDLSGNKMNEAMQSAEVDGLHSLNDGITDAITGAKSLGDVFHDISRQIIADLVKIAVEKEIVGPLANSLFGGAGGGAGVSGGGGLMSKLFSAFSGSSGGTAATAGLDLSQWGTMPIGFATGGSFRVGGRAGVDQNLVTIRATKGEIVDVRRPGQAAMGDGGAGFSVAIGDIHLHAEGAGPREVDMLRGEVARLKQEIPARVVAAYQDARSRGMVPA